MHLHSLSTRCQYLFYHWLIETESQHAFSMYCETLWCYDPPNNVLKSLRSVMLINIMIIKGNLSHLNTLAPFFFKEQCIHKPGSTVTSEDKYGKELKISVHKSGVIRTVYITQLTLIVQCSIIAFIKQMMCKITGTGENVLSFTLAPNLYFVSS